MWLVVLPALIYFFIFRADVHEVFGIWEIFTSSSTEHRLLRPQGTDSAVEADGETEPDACLQWFVRL